MSTARLFSATLGALGLAAWAASATAAGLKIDLPQETAAFKPGQGVEIVNAQCLICHSADYVLIQPRLPRAFWLGNVQKMQQKYGAPIPEDQVAPVVEYLTQNYGQPSPVESGAPVTKAPPVASAAGDGVKLAAKYGCISCHNPSFKLVGPALKQIADKYRTDVEALAKVSQQITHGGSGKWGPIPMPPFVQMAPGDVEQLARWVLDQK